MRNSMSGKEWGPQMIIMEGDIRNNRYMVKATADT